MPVIVKVLLPVAAGALVALGVAVGLVSSQSGAPDQNPASSEIINYGDQS